MGIIHNFILFTIAGLTLWGGGMAIDEDIRIGTLDTIASIYGFFIDSLFSILTFFIHIISFGTLSQSLITGAFKDSIFFFASGWILIVSYIVYIFAVLIFIASNFYTVFLVYEFFVLALCIQEDYSALSKITKFFDLHIILFSFGLMIVSFLFNLPQLIYEFIEILCDILTLIWRIISDLGKIFAALLDAVTPMT